MARRFSWVFLLGSACHHHDDARLGELEALVVNDCGTLDIFPVLAAALRSRRFGHTGVVGFNNHPIVDRFYKCGHSDGKSARHFEENIIGAFDGTKLMEPWGVRPAGWMLLAPTIYA